MTLGQRIRCYRGRKGLSQEALAEQVGVSRQAVSKWETDAATPEVDKLVALARAFGITTDQLLTEEEPAKEVPPEAPHARQDRLDHVGGWLGHLIRRWGWLSGVYLAVWGAWVILVGVLAHTAFKRQLAPIIELVGKDTFITGMGASITFPLMVSKIAIGIGVVMIIAGAALAVYLRRKR